MSNPPPVPLMQSLSGGDPYKQADIKDLHTFLFLLRQQIGGDSAFADLTAQIQELIDLTDITVVSTAVDYTTTDNALVRVTAEATITLNATPVDREYVGVLHDATSGVQVSITDGTSTDVLLLNNTIIWYTYYSDLARWVP